MTSRQLEAEFPTVISTPRWRGERKRRVYKKADKWLMVSFCLSLLLHGGVWAVWRLRPAEPVRHVFILLNSGDQAMETSLGGAEDSTPVQQSVREEVREKRYAPEKLVDERFDKPTDTLEELSESEALPDEQWNDREMLRAPLIADADGVFSKPFSRKRERDEEVPMERELPEPVEEKPEEVPEDVKDAREASFASAASAASSKGGSGGMVVGVRQRARPSGEGFLLLYPEEARMAGESGVVGVEASIGADGVCVSAKVTATSGFEVLDRAALDAVRGARYHPAYEDGEPVFSRESFEIVFEFDD